jgi:hypothetical protein
VDPDPIEEKNLHRSGRGEETSLINYLKILFYLRNLSYLRINVLLIAYLNSKRPKFCPIA